MKPVVMEERDLFTALLEYSVLATLKGEHVSDEDRAYYLRILEDAKSAAKGQHFGETER